jgi:hypothetical protein
VEPEDSEHLRLLSIFHYVVAGIAFLFAAFPALYFFLGILILSGVIPTEGPAGMEWVAGLFVLGFAVAGIVLSVGLSILLLMAGSYLRKRTRHTFCVVVAGIACLFMPFGTVLGILTIIVLMRPSVKASFDNRPEEGTVEGLP